MDTLRMTKARGDRWRALMRDVRSATAARCGVWHNSDGSPQRDTLYGMSALLKRSEGGLYTVVRLGRIFRGALQIDRYGAGKDMIAAIRLIERAKEDGRITASQRTELFEIMGVPSHDHKSVSTIGGAS